MNMERKTLHINTTAVHGGARKDDCFGRHQRAHLT